MARPKVIAHRGASAYEPENTLAAVKLAFRMGVDAVEVDVRASAEGELVVIHDEKVDRTTGGRGYVRELTLYELRRLKVSGSERIPLLAEVLDEVYASGKTLVIELKEPGLEERVVKLVRERGLTERVEVVSFFHPSVRRVKELEPALRTGVIFTCLPVNPVELALRAGADILVPRKDFVDLRLVEEAHKNSLEVYVWVVDEEGEAIKFKAMGVDGIATNKPDVVLRAVRGY